MIAGPTTLPALLNSLQMGFRTLAIQQRSSEVWQVLGAVRTEFGKFGEVLDEVRKQLSTVGNTIDDSSRRSRAHRAQAARRRGGHRAGCPAATGRRRQPHRRSKRTPRATTPLG